MKINLSNIAFFMTFAVVAIPLPSVLAIDDSEDEVAEVNAVYLAAASQETPAKSTPDVSSPSSTDASAPSKIEQFKVAGELLFLADDARDAKNWREAGRLYHQALQRYKKLSVLYPDWQPSVTRFRTVYCENQMTEMYKRLGQPVPAVPPSGPPSTTAQKKPPETTPAIVPEPAPRAAPDTSPPSSNVVAAARDLLLKSEPLAARDVLIEGLRRDPDNRAIRLLIGVAQCQSTNYLDAAHVLETLVEDDPANAFAYLTLGTARFGLGDLPEARAALDKALEINPALSEAHYNLAHLLLLLSPPDYAAARKHYQKALQSGAPADPSLEKRLNPGPARPAGEAMPPPAMPLGEGEPSKDSKRSAPPPPARAPLTPLLLIQCH